MNLQQQIVELYKAKTPKYRIAIKLKCSRSYVYQILIQAGLYKPKVKSWLLAKKDKSAYVSEVQKVEPKINIIKK